MGTITVNSLDDASFTYTPSTVCKTGGTDPSPVISGTSGGTFSCPDVNLVINSSSGLITLASSPVATYTVTYTTSGACPDFKTFVLAIVSVPAAIFSYAGPYCQNATPNPIPTFPFGSSAGIFTELTGGLQFVSSTTGEINMTTSSSGTYTVTNTIAAGGGCSAAVFTNTITINPVPVTTVNNQTVCAGSSATLTGSGATSYSWSDGSALSSLTISPALTTSYTVTGTTAGCSSSALATITINPSPVVSVNSSTICQGTSTTLTASGANTYSWLPITDLNLTTGAIVTANPSSPTTYTVSGVAVNGCTNNATSFVVVNSVPIVNPGSDVTISFPSSTQLVASGGSSYSWSQPTGLSCINCPNPIASPTVTTNYCVVVIDANSCTDSACVKITVETPCITNKNLEVPNAFSPNNDGSNDMLILHGWENCITQFTFIVYDRWGEKVFESNDPTRAWDGTFRGKPLDPAVFVYYINATLTTNEKISKKGNISLIR